jgi:phosphoglycolate phosphatase
VHLCVFDLDHTLVRSPLDLAAMALDMRASLERACGPMPPRAERYRVGEVLAHCRATAPAHLDTLWGIALDHERRAVAEASLEPGADLAVAGARDAGCATAVWTNNAREVAMLALERFGLAPEIDLVVTRDESLLKPDPDGWRVLGGHFAVPPEAAVVVGDSWVDGLAAARAGVPFVAYRAKADDLARFAVTPVAHLDDLAALPAWLDAARRSAGRR